MSNDYDARMWEENLDPAVTRPSRPSEQGDKEARIVHCLEMMLTAMQTQSILSEREYEEKLSEIEDFIVNYLGEEC